MERDAERQDQEEQRVEEHEGATGATTGPPGGGELDEDAAQEAQDKLDQAGGGH